MLLMLSAQNGGGASGVDASVVVVPTTGVAVADGAAEGPTQPIDLGGGTEAQALVANPELEASGLATRFQPYSLDGVARALEVSLAVWPRKAVGGTPG